MNSARSSWGARVFGSTPDNGRGAPTGRGVEPGPGRGGIRRAAGPARRILAPLRPRRISGRTAALTVLLFALMLAYAYPLRVYLGQQAQIAQMQADQETQRRRIEDLAVRVERWKDEEYVRAQARSRLQLVREGELLYFVGAPPVPAGAPDDGEHEAWFRRLWSNLQAADEPDAP